MKRFVIAVLFLLATVPAFSQEPADTVFALPSPYQFRDGQKIKVWKAEAQRNERTRNDADFSWSGQATGVFYQLLFFSVLILL
ncbi:MAG: hypothetical protein IJQ93_01885 [Bacteroidales bacterium]|nr:hypothetical protein [Bacteroidales bacterium]